MLSADWLKRHGKDFDFQIVLVLLCISVISTLAIYSVTIHRSGMEDWYRKEIMWQVVSYVGMFSFIMLDYRVFRNRAAWIGYGISLFLLIVVFAFPAVKGAHSWITVPGFQFQPSEFAKIFIILVIADFMAKSKAKEETFGWKHAGFITAVAGVPLLLILKQPALG